MVRLTSAQTKKIPLTLQWFYRPSLLQAAKEVVGDSVKSERGRFQVLKSGISIHLDNLPSELLSAGWNMPGPISVL